MVNEPVTAVAPEGAPAPDKKVQEVPLIDDQLIDVVAPYAMEDGAAVRVTAGRGVKVAEVTLTTPLSETLAVPVPAPTPGTVTVADFSPPPQETRL